MRPDRERQWRVEAEANHQGTGRERHKARVRARSENANWANRSMGSPPCETTPFAVSSVAVAADYVNSLYK